MTGPDPQTIWPDLTDWTSTGWKDDGSVPFLRDGRLRVRPPREGMLRARDATLSTRSEIPVPTVIDERDGWLLLAALPGVPLDDASWVERPDAAVDVVVTALQALATAAITQGNLCLPNILGDPETGQLTGIVDWTHANRFSREVDLGAVTWSWELDHPSLHPSGEIEILKGIGWSKCDAEEVDRLTAFWLANGYWNE
jgi:aminoglycoside phosphotransferase